MTDNTHNDSDKTLRIGARVAVELLRMRAEKSRSANITLVPMRTKNAMAVLRDRMMQIQQEKSREGVFADTTATLDSRCQDSQLVLPVAEPDWGAILLLDQLFNELLANNELDDQASQWLASLRLPVIRYALMDYSFFFAPQNLVRRFLNQLYLALLSSSEKSRQVIRDSLEPFLTRINRDFKQDVSVFNSICIEAQTWFAGHADRVGQIEDQIRSKESVLNKERVAEPRVVRELNRIAAGKILPKMLLEFLHGEWRRSLRLVSMREGEDGATWRRQIRITESLVEFALGCANEKGRDEHRNFYPVLIKNIKSLLVSVNEDADALEEAIDPLELILTAMLSGANPEPVTVPELKLEQDHVTAVEVKKVASWARREIERLEIGDWVRIKTVDGSHELCRLTIKSEADEPWVLVSQSGRTVTKKTAFQLAQGLEGSVLEVVGQGDWWDEHLNNNMMMLHERWQAEMASRPKSDSRPKPKPVPQPEPELQNEMESPAEGALSLVPQEQVDQEAGRIAAFNSRTAEILQDSELALMDDSAVDVSTEADETEDFLAPREISDEEHAAAIQAVDQIQVGGWIIQQTSKGEERCKLAVKIRGREKLIFVNRLGVKVLEIDRAPLADLLARGMISIVDTGEKFDNTLERVVRSIQKDSR